jgi:hypothetical protein
VLTAQRGSIGSLDDFHEQESMTTSLPTIHISRRQRASLWAHRLVDRIDSVLAACLRGRYEWRQISPDIQCRTGTPMAAWLRRLLPVRPNTQRMKLDALVARYASRNQ